MRIQLWLCKPGGASGKARMTRAVMQEREELNWDLGASGKNGSCILLKIFLIPSHHSQEDNEKKKKK